MIRFCRMILPVFYRQKTTSMNTNFIKSVDWKKYIPNALIFLLFLIASAIYFYPALQGQTIYAGDGINGRSAVQEGVAYHEATGDYSYWTGSMFSGMPNYQIGGGERPVLNTILYPVRWVLGWGTHNVFFIFLYYLIAFFLLLRTFKIDKWVSMAGAFAIALSGYFFVIIAASHHGKCYSITWMTLVIIGFVLTYRKQYGWGAVLVAFFTYIGFFLHPQMSYYICMLIGVLFFAELAIVVRSKEWKHFAIATALFAVSFAIGMGMGSASIFSNQEYAAETMRGGHSDLVKSTDATNKTAGLDIDYATAWSYGIDETMTFLIPNYMGGASGYNLGEGSQLEKDLKKMGVPARQAKQFCQSAPTYRGEKAFTSGPVYMGAIVCFLFLLALLLVDGPYKWALLVATLFSVTLAWGHHFMPLTELFFRYFPVYNKFRAVESILIVAEITMPLLGFMALKTIADGRLPWRRVRNSLFVAGGVTAALCALVALLSSSIDVASSYDAQWKAQVGPQIYDAILDQRTAMIRSDAWRSFGFVAAGFLVVFVYAYARYFQTRKNLNLYFGLALTVLVIADMWPVDKRFCNDSYFRPQKDINKAYAKLPYEEQLLQDSTHFRVLNLSTNTFNEARTSYYLKSIGGYSAAKLRRYQDLIDVHIAPEMQPLMTAIQQTYGFETPCNADSLFPVLNMLNMKYAIVPLQGGQQIPVANPYAMGNCWLVDGVKSVGNANDEIAALSTENLHTTAVVDSAFLGALDTAIPEAAPLVAYDTDRIELTHYAPNRLEYRSQNEQNRIAVFSEIYYPHGWKLYLTRPDGSLDQELPIARVNYMLRAAVIPAGTHTLAMVFDPACIHKGNALSLACFALFLLLVAGAVTLDIRRCKQSRKAAAASESTTPQR